MDWGIVACYVRKLSWIIPLKKQSDAVHTTTKNTERKIGSVYYKSYRSWVSKLYNSRRPVQVTRTSDADENDVNCTTDSLYSTKTSVIANLNVTVSTILLLQISFSVLLPFSSLLPNARDCQWPQIQECRLGQGHVLVSLHIPVLYIHTI